MSFYAITDIANDLRDLLTSSGIFKDVRVAAITSYEDLLVLIPQLARLPAAVVCVGTGDINTERTLLTVRPGIVVVDQFRADLDAKSVGIWTILDKTLDIFLPAGGPRNPLQINGVPYWPESFRPVVLSGAKCSAYMIELKALTTKR